MTQLHQLKMKQNHDIFNNSQSILLIIKHEKKMVALVKDTDKDTGHR